MEEELEDLVRSYLAALDQEAIEMADLNRRLTAGEWVTIMTGVEPESAKLLVRMRRVVES